MTESTNTISSVQSNEFKSEIRDIVGLLSQIAGLEEMIKELTADAKEKYGMSPGDMKGIAKKDFEDKLNEELGKLDVKMSYMELLKESGNE